MLKSDLELFNICRFRLPVGWRKVGFTGPSAPSPPRRVAAVNDIRHTAEYLSIAEHLNRLHEPAFGRPHALSEPEVSADGARVLITGQVLEKLSGVPRPKVFTVQDGELIAVASDGSSRSGRFSSSGEKIAFVSDRVTQGEFQLFLADADSVDRAAAAPAVAGTIEYLQWSVDDRRILLGVAGVGADISGGQGSGVNKATESGLPAWHPDVETGTTPDSAWRTLWVYECETGNLTRVSPEGMNCWEASWCGPDGVLTIASDVPEEDSWYSASLSIIDLVESTSRELLTSRVQLALPSGSPDGGYASVVEAVCSDRMVVAGDLSVIDLSTGERTVVDTAETDVTAAHWYSDRKIGFVGQRGLRSVLGRFDVSNHRAEVLHVSDRSWGVRYPDVALSARGEAVIVEDAYRLPHQVVRIAKGKVEVLATVAHLGTEYLLSVCGRSAPISWMALDGLEIEGILCTPEGEGPFPLVVNIHGGPVWAFQDAWSMHYPWVPLLVARGYAVLNPNPRGSGGRGQDFAGRVAGDMGGEDTGDYLSGIDALVDQGVVDPARVGLIGGSYGGYMSSWLVTQDQRFAAAVPIAPVTDWYSQSFTSNIAGWGNAFLGADPESPGSMAHTRSPVLQASKVRTPCLNIAGAQDLCTPPGQAREFHQALRSFEVDSALVIYPLEGHGLRDYSSMTDALTRITQWFERYMPA